jgi:acyl-CoA synthetase (AMP-forming)/AMP-acid ligase II
MSTEGLWPIFRSLVSGAPSSTAITVDDRTTSFEQLRARVLNLAADVGRLADSRERPTLFTLVSSFDKYAALLLASSVLGARIVVADARSSLTELSAQVRLTRPNILVTESTSSAAMSASSVLASSFDRVMDVDEVRSGTVHDALRRTTGSGMDAVFFTSGTQSEPKAVLLAEEALTYPLYTLRLLAEAMLSEPAAADLPSDLWESLSTPLRLSLLPNATIAQHTQLTQALLSGQELVAVSGFRTDSILDLIEARGVTNVIGSPYMLSLLARRQAQSERVVDSVRVVGAGGGPMTRKVYDDISAAFPRAYVLRGYGSTEVGGGVAGTRFTDSEESRALTVGRAYPGNALRIAVDGQTVSEPGIVGELEVRVAGGLSSGYLTMSESVLAPLPLRGSWYATSDLAEIDTNGYLTLHGRLDDVVNRAGSKIVVGDIEELLEGRADVARAAVVGVPHDRYGEELVAVVARAAETATEQSLLADCAATFPPAKVPARVIFVEDFPTTTSGKIRKAQLIGDLLT